MKKPIAMLLSITLLFMFSACNKKEAIKKTSVKSEQQSTSEVKQSNQGTAANQITTANRVDIANQTTKVNQPTKASTGTTTPSGSKEPADNSCKHAFTTSVYNATCTEDGYTLYSCSKCGYSYKGNIIPAGHTYKNYLCERCGKADLSHPYEALRSYLMSCGKKYGGNYYLDYTTAEQYTSVTYDVENGKIYFAGTLLSYENKLSVFVYISKVNNTYECFAADDYFRGWHTITASTFSENSTITFSSYDGSPEDKEINQYATKYLLLDTIIVANHILENSNTGLRTSHFGFNV